MSTLSASTSTSEWEILTPSEDHASARLAQWISGQGYSQEEEEEQEVGGWSSSGGRIRRVSGASSVSVISGGEVGLLMGGLDAFLEGVELTPDCREDGEEGGGACHQEMSSGEGATGGRGQGHGHEQEEDTGMLETTTGALIPLHWPSSSLPVELLEPSTIPQAEDTDSDSQLADVLPQIPLADLHYPMPLEAFFPGLFIDTEAIYHATTTTTAALPIAGPHNTDSHFSVDSLPEIRVTVSPKKRRRSEPDVENVTRGCRAPTSSPTSPVVMPIQMDVPETDAVSLGGLCGSMISDTVAPTQRDENLLMSIDLQPSLPSSLITKIDSTKEPIPSTFVLPDGTPYPSKTLWKTLYNVLTQIAVDIVPNIIHSGNPGNEDEEEDMEMEIVGSSMLLFHSFTRSIVEEMTDAFIATTGMDTMDPHETETATETREIEETEETRDIEVIEGIEGRDGDTIVEEVHETDIRRDSRDYRDRDRGEYYRDRERDPRDYRDRDRERGDPRGRGGRSRSPSRDGVRRREEYPVADRERERERGGGRGKDYDEGRGGRRRDDDDEDEDDRRGRRRRSYTPSEDEEMKDAKGEEENEGELTEEQKMMKLMGFGGFDTTKEKKIPGKDVGAVNIVKKRTYRQYMNRRALEEFEELCFDFGIELEEETSEKEMAAKEMGAEKAAGLSSRLLYRIDIPANRYDLLCPEGIVRALKVYLGSMKPPTYKVVKPAGPMEKLTVSAATNPIRPFVVAAILRNVTFTQNNYESFIDLQDKLHNNLCRKRTLVAIGTHDLDTVKGPFTYEALAPEHIKFVPLNQTKEMNARELMTFYEADRKLSKFLHIIRDSPVYPVIYDSKRTVMSLPPIINGDHSKIKLTTKNVFIECTATDLTKANVVLNTVVTMFSEYCSEPFTVEPVEVIDAKSNSVVYPDLTPRVFKTDSKYLNSRIGIDLPEDRIIELLTKMGLTSKPNSEGGLDIHAPPTRSDILHACDVAEDLAIGYGYNNIVKTMPKANTIGKSFSLNKLSDQVRREIALVGYSEVLALTLCSHDENFAFLRRKDDGNTAVKLANPKTIEFQVVRTTLLPGLLKTVASNKNMPLPIKIFEVSDVVFKNESIERCAYNQRNVAVMYSNIKTSGFELIHGVLDRIMMMLAVEHVEVGQPNGYYIKESENPTFFPGRRADVYYQNKLVGTFGIIHPEVLQHYEFQYPSSALELNLEPFV
ncbi:hypothetical protein HDV05_005773 [Chytridiales sp. JEL 0842]|nr:hypothetical protein HDV05_005773 [Chytridiales sp. JEL 0842]